MAEDLNGQYAGRLGHNVLLALQAFFGGVRSALVDLSSQLTQYLRSLLASQRPSISDGLLCSSCQQQMTQQEIEAARDSAQRQTALANGFGALTDLPSALATFASQPTISGSSTQATVGAIESNNTADNSDDDSMSINCEDPPVCESHTDDAPEINEQTIDEMAKSISNTTSNTSNFNSNNDSVSVKTETEELIARRGNTEEIGDFHLIDQVGDSMDESYELPVMEEEEANETQSIDNTNPNDSNFEIENDKEPHSDPVMNESNKENDQAGPSLYANSVSLLTRRSARFSAAKKVNNSEAMENSVINQQVIMQTERRKRKRPNKLTDNVSVPKRIRTQIVVASDEEEEAEEAVSMSVTVLQLKCSEKGCKTKKKFLNKVQLNEHLLAKHLIEKYRCHLKGCTTFSFATHAELKDHRKSVHRKVKSWPCALCPTICTSYKDLSTHFSENHQVGSFGCSAERCTFTEKTRKRVRNHQESKHRQRKYRCTFAGCNSSFNRSSHRSDHLLLHTQAKPFPCDECTKAYTQKSHLTVHKRSHSGLKPYHCSWPQCDFSVSDLSNAKGHVRTVHFGLPRTKKEQAQRQIIDTRDAGQFIRKVTTN